MVLLLDFYYRIRDFYIIISYDSLKGLALLYLVGHLSHY